MANIKIAGNNAILTSSFTVEQIQLLKKRNPGALVLKDEKDKPIFAIGVGATGSVSPVGIVFDGKALGTGMACITYKLPASVVTEDDAREWIMDEIGLAIVKLNQIESGMTDAFAKVEAENEAVNATIVFAD